MSLAVKTEDSDCYLAIRFVSAGRVDHSLSFIDWDKQARAQKAVHSLYML